MSYSAADEFDFILRAERRWKARLAKMDLGSYCEPMEPKAAAAQKILIAYRDLTDALRDFERKHE